MKLSGRKQARKQARNPGTRSWGLLRHGLLFLAAASFCLCQPVLSHAQAQSAGNGVISIPQPCAVLNARLTSAGPAIRSNLEAQMDTERIQNALDLCDPGQAVVLRTVGAGAGKEDAFLSAPLILPRGVTLVVAAGVTVYASRNPRDYDLAPSSCGAVRVGKAAQCKPFLFSYQAAFSGVMGAGAIDGQGGLPLRPGSPSWWRKRRAGAGRGQRIAVPSLVSDYESQGFRVVGVSLRNSPDISLAVFKTTDFEASGISITSTPRSSAGAGILLSNVQGAQIEDAAIRTDAAAIELEASILGPTYGVHLSRLSIDGGGISIGNRDYGNVNHVWLRNVAIREARHPVTVIVGAADGKKPAEIALNNVSSDGKAAPVRVLGENGQSLPLAAAGVAQSTQPERSPSSSTFQETRFAPIPPAAEPPGAKPRLIVAQDGSGDFTSIQRAIDALPNVGGEVLVKPGTYREVVTIRKPHVGLRGLGSDPEAVTVVYNNTAGKSGGTFNTATVFVEADNVTVSHLTIANDAGYGKGQAVALAVTGDRDVFRWVDIDGHQDTLFAASKYCYGDYGPCIPARQYFSHCSIDGNVDFVFGDSMAVFDHCELHGNPRGNVMYTAQSRHTARQQSGYVFDHCTLTASPRTHGKIALGRPWRPYATVVYLNTRMDADVIPQGWMEWPRFGVPSLPTAFYAEYNSSGPGADPKAREPYSHQLTGQQAKRFLPMNFLRGRDGWSPVGAQDEIRAVILLMRHGVRAPIANETRANAYNAQPWPQWPVAPGVLTKHGAAALRILGAYYRTRYASLLQQGSCSQPVIYAEAAATERTIASAQAVLSGLAPGCSIAVRRDKDRLFSAGDRLVNQIILRSAIAGRMANHPDWFAHVFAAPLETMHEALTHCSGADCNRLKPDFRSFVVQDGRTRKRTEDDENSVGLAADFAENFLLEYTEGLPLDQVGWGRVPRARLDELMAMNTRYHDFMLRTPYWAEVAASRLAERISATLTAQAEGRQLPDQFGNPRTRVVLLDGSDSHLSWLGGLLRLSWLLPDQTIDATPPGGGLVFELGRNPASGADQVEVFFISQTLDQIRYLRPLGHGQIPSIAPIYVPGCSSPGPPYACSVAGFAKVVSRAVDLQVPAAD